MALWVGYERQLDETFRLFISAIVPGIFAANKWEPKYYRHFNELFRSPI